MYIQTQINTDIPIFEAEDTLENLKHFFNESTYSHVAIVSEKRFLGVFNENDLEDFNPEDKIENYRYNFEAFFTRKEVNWLDILEVFARNEANVVPVLGENEDVLGYYDLADVMKIFIDTPFFTEPGNIVIVAKGIKDYSFSEIAQIVESNNSKIIGSFISDSENDVVQITIKISTSNFNEVVQSFRRYNYNVLFGNSDDQFLEDLKQRSDYLDKYLNV